MVIQRYQLCVFECAKLHVFFDTDKKKLLIIQIAYNQCDTRSF